MRYDEKLIKWCVGENKLADLLHPTVQLIRECGQSKLHCDSSPVQANLQSDHHYSCLFRLHLQALPTQQPTWRTVVGHQGFGRFCQLRLLGHSFATLESWTRRVLQSEPKSPLNDRMTNRVLQLCRYLVDQPKLLTMIPRYAGDVRTFGWTDLVINHEPVDYFDTWPSYCALHDAAVVYDTALARVVKHEALNQQKDFVRGNLTTISAPGGAKKLIKPLPVPEDFGKPPEHYAKLLADQEPTACACPMCEMDLQLDKQGKPQQVSGVDKITNDLTKLVCPKPRLLAHNGKYYQRVESGNTLDNTMEIFRYDDTTYYRVKDPAPEKQNQFLPYPQQDTMLAELAKETRALQQRGFTIDQEYCKSVMDQRYEGIEVKPQEKAFLNCYAHADADLKAAEKMINRYVPMNVMISGRNFDPLSPRFEQIAELLFKQEDHRLQDQTEHQFWTLHSLVSKKSATGPDTYTLTFCLCPMDPCETKSPEGIGCGRCDVTATLEHRDGVVRYWWACGNPECSAHGTPKKFGVKWPELDSPEKLVAFLAHRLASKISRTRA
jgi:hypothetical protein